MIQLFFDTNVWFDYCWVKLTSKKRSVKNFIDVSKINSRKARVTISDPLIYEISTLFKERFLVKQAFDEGISAFEIRRIKRDMRLKNSDRKKVDDILLKNIYSISCTKGQWLIEWLDQSILDKVFRLTSTTDIEFIDCLHIMTAIQDRCEAFITKDEPLVTSFQRAQRKYPSLRNLTIMKPTEFLSRYQRTIFKK